MAQDQDELENDVDSSDASGDLDVAANQAPVGTLSMRMPSAPAPAPMDPTLQRYLENKQQMADAQDKVRNNEMLTGLARAGASLSAGLARANAPVDQTPFNEMAATDQQPVTDILNSQKAEATDLSNKKDALTTSKEAADQDPNSPQSIAAKNLIKKLYPGKFDDDTLADLSAADVGNSIMKPLELDEKIQAHKDEVAGRNADHRLLAGQKSDENQNKAE